MIKALGSLPPRCDEHRTNECKSAVVIRRLETIFYVPPVDDRIFVECITDACLLSTVRQIKQMKRAELTEMKRAELTEMRGGVGGRRLLIVELIRLMRHCETIAGLKMERFQWVVQNRFRSGQLLVAHHLVILQQIHVVNNLVGRGRL